MKSKEKIMELFAELRDSFIELHDNNNNLRKQLEAVQSEEKKVPVRELPEGTFFRLHSAGNLKYIKVCGYERNNVSVCAINLCSGTFFSNRANDTFANSTNYTIIPNPFKK